MNISKKTHFIGYMIKGAYTIMFQASNTSELLDKNLYVFSLMK